MAQKFKDIELGFIRKRDGKVVNVKLIEIFRKFRTVDFINNEVVLDGEVFIADSFRERYEEVKLDVVKNALEGSGGTYRYLENSYDGNQQFNVEKDTTALLYVTPDINSRVRSIVDELGNSYPARAESVAILMNDNHTLTITFEPAIV